MHQTTLQLQITQSINKEVKKWSWR